MDELATVRRLLGEAPAPAAEVVTAARARLDRAVRGSLEQAARETGGSRRRVPARVLWPAAAAGVAAAVIAGVITGQVIAPGAGLRTGARQSTAVLAVKELANRAAAAAAHQPSVRPGQWVFWQEKAAGPGSGTHPNGPWEVWTTANAQRAAMVYQHRVIYIGPGPYDGQPVVGPGNSAGATVWKIPVSFQDLRSLPDSPQALDRYLAALRWPHWQDWGTPAAREFQIIEAILTSYVMSPRLTAELYQALSHVPGVTVDRRAVDVAGRHGIGFVSPRLPEVIGAPAGGAEEIILNPRTYHLMGYGTFAYGYPQSRSGVAILREDLVSGPGVQP